MPAATSPHVKVRDRLRDSAGHALKLNAALAPLVVVKPTTPSGVFHGKIDFSQPPWHAPVATAYLGMHALARKLERDMRWDLDLPPRDRGPSDQNTVEALKAVVALAEKAEDQYVVWNCRLLETWSRTAAIALGIAEVPRRLPRNPGKTEPKCPFCEKRTLRYKTLNEEIYCVNPACKDDNDRKPSAHMEFSKHAGDWVMVWQDGLAGVPA